MIKFNKKVAACVAVMAAVSAVTAASLSSDIKKTTAYFTDTESHVNNYSFGDITTDGTETNWNPEKTKNMVPLQIEAKNPRIENTGTNQAIGFIVLDSPITRNVQLADNKTGALLPEADVEDILYLKADKSVGFNDTNWKLIDSYYINEKGVRLGDAMTPAGRTPEGTKKRRYVFGYDDSIKGGSVVMPTKTDTLFDYIQTQNFVEGTFESGKVYDVTVYFVTIQAENLQLSNNVVTTIANTQNMSKAMLSEIYAIAASRVDFSTVPEANTSNKLDLYEKPITH